MSSRKTDRRAVASEHSGASTADGGSFSRRQETAHGPAPGPRQPRIAQLLHYTFRPLGFFEESLARHGDPFTLRLTGLGDFVMVTRPELLKQVFTADAAELTAGSANKILAPITGPRSVLLLDGAEHLRMRRLLMPPLHGERMQAYATAMARATDDAVAGFPEGRPFALYPYMHLAHRQTDAWPEPERFRPERFLCLKVDPYRWFPFGGGIRRCLGMAFALHGMKVVLATVIARARLRLTRPVKVVRRTITLAPSHGTEVTLVERRPRARPAPPLRAAS